MARAVIIGGTGAIGRAAARRLLATGWSVELTGRDPARMPRDIAAAGGRFIAADRQDAGRLRAAFGDGADLLVDCACFTAEDAAGLLPLARDTASTVLISSKAVYVDAAGRHSNSPVKPDFGGPVREDQPTVAPGYGDYRSAEGYPAGKVAAEQVLLDSGVPVTVLRPSKIHGPGSRQPREWVFVKRVLDRRPVLFLAHRGAGVDHPTAAANIAALIDLAAARPGRRILNAADPDAPSALEISRIIARHLGHTWDEVLLDDQQARPGQAAPGQPAPGQPAPGQPALGRHPWDRPHPVVLDMTAAAGLGYTPAGDYAATVAAEVDWLIAAAQGGEDADLIPGPGDEYFAPLLDYGGEDRWLAAHTHSPDRERRMSEMRMLEPGPRIADPLAPYEQVTRTRADGRSWVMAHMVGGLDGSAAIRGRVGDLSTAPDAELFRLMRGLADVVLVGAETVRAENYGVVRLSAERAAARVAAGRAATPPLAVVSRSLRLDWSARAFADAPPEARTLVITCAAADPVRLAEARQVADVIVAGADRVDPALALQRLGGRGYRVVLCEGGPTWLGELAAAGLVDELCLTLSPLMGGDPLPVSIAPPGAPLAHFSLRHVLRAGDTLFFRYERGPDVP